MELINSETSVLVIYETSNVYLDHYIEEILIKTSNITKKRSSDILKLEKPVSTYDVIFSGNCYPFDINHDSSLLSVILKLLKISGHVTMNQATGSKGLITEDQFLSQLKLSGFTNISIPTEIKFLKQTDELLQKDLNTSDIKVISVSCWKPKFEIGSSIPLNLKQKETNDVAAVWKIDDTIDDDLETIDPDNLLDDDDIIKPAFESLKVCSTTGKRKACKDCSCGLAEELSGEEKNKQDESLPKSSCGSCYLGDAFRCASCPYIGMPAFKPGEKIQLSTNQLQADK